MGLNGREYNTDLPHSIDDVGDDKLMQWVHRWLTGEPVLWNGTEFRFPNGAGYVARVVDHLCEGQYGYKKHGMQPRHLTE